jgi:hypothetical protein
MEGGLWAITAHGAMTSLEDQQKTWNVSRIDTVCIFGMEDGVVNDDPEIFVNHLLKSSTNGRKTYREHVRDATILKVNVHKEYEEGDWCRELEVPKAFITAKHKEEDAS